MCYKGVTEGKIEKEKNFQEHYQSAKQYGSKSGSMFMSVLIRVQNACKGFFFDEWIQIPLKLSHHRPTSKTPFKWRFAGVPMMAQH